MIKQFLKQSRYTFSSLRGDQQNSKTAVFMLNLGGPENLDQVSPFLERLFSDTTVIRIPFGLGQYIGKIRGPAKVQKQYEEIGGGSPIRKWTETQGDLMLKQLENSNNQEKLAQKFGPISVSPAFRYSDPLYTDIIREYIKDNSNLEQIVLFSQYPQWSCSTAGNSIRESLKVIKEAGFPFNKVKIIDRWYQHPLYINALTEILFEDLQKNFTAEEQEQLVILFSAHSLPVDFIQQGDPYSMEIGTTTNLVMQNLQKKLQENGNKKTQIPFRVVWQSKVGFNQWLKPNTSDALEFYSKTYKNAIITPMGFTSDHLETLFELDLEYIEENKDKYQKIFRARSLNDNPIFVSSLAKLVEDVLLEQNEISEYPNPNFGIRCPDCFCPDDCKILSEYYTELKK